MSGGDRYLDFATTAFGRRIVRAAGLPGPVRLPRRRPDDPGPAPARAPVLVGAGPGARLLDPLADALGAAGEASLYHPGTEAWRDIATRHRLMAARLVPADRPRASALVFDASGIADAAGLGTLYEFFHDTVRIVGTGGRALVLATPPAAMATAEGAAIQRGLEGFVRSLGREVRRGIAVQLLEVEPGAEAAIGSTLAFLLSPASAYVSGQRIRIGAPVAPVPAPPPPGAPSQEGRTVLVTGAARGIGASIAALFAREGARVLAVDVPRAADALAALAERIGGARLALDIASDDAPARIVEWARAQGGLDVVVHNAGITRDRTLARMPPASWDEVIAVNLAAPVRITAALLDAEAVLRPNGRVVCVSSLSGIAGNAGQTNYALSKAGLIGLVERLAPRAAASGVTVNAVAPGFIETAMTAAIPMAIRQAGRRMNAMGQGGLPVDVAEAVAWLAHPGSGGVNGATLRVCGQSLLGA